MKMRELGRSGLKVSALGLGCMGMSWSYGPTNDAESIAVIHHAIDVGITFFDTAELYGNGHNEQLLGRAIKGKRHNVIVATKFGLRLDNNGMVMPADGRPAYLKAACDVSLKTLGIDCIDLYYQHRVDPKTPIEDTVGAMAELVKAGKVKHLGLSEAAAGTVRRACKVHPIAALQTEYSLWARDVETEILPACRELGVGFVPYSPLGRGMLAGAFTSLADIKKDGDKRGAMPRYSDANFDTNLRLTEKLAAYARVKGLTLGQLALAWLLAKGSDIVPIPGTRKKERLDENARAVTAQLTAADMEEIDRVFPLSAIAGARNTERGLAAVNL